MTKNVEFVLVLGFLIKLFFWHYINLTKRKKNVSYACVQWNFSAITVTFARIEFLR
jgi:hypothetical protein